MTEAIIASGDARPIGAQIEDQLTSARHLSVMIQWIGIAREFIEAVQIAAKHLPDLETRLRALGAYANDADWTDAEGAALRHMHQRIEWAIRDIEKKVGLAEGGPL